MKISVAMCTYNGAPYLREQLDSIARQILLPDELIICDDRSTDTTAEIANSFTAAAPFPVTFVVNDQNLGTVKNFERAIGLSAGDIIALADQDDVWLPDKLLLIEDCFVKDPAVGLVFTDADVVDQNLQPLGYRLWESVGFDERHRRLMQNGRALDVLLPGWTVTGATMAFRGRFKDLVPDIPTDLPIIHDGWIALLIAAVARVSFIDEPLIKYRQHDRQQIGAKRKEPDQDSSGLSGVRSAARRTNSYLGMIAIGMRARDHLSRFKDLYECDGALRALGARLTHLHARASLPPQKLGRLPCIWRELTSKRYQLYSNGIKSAVKDLLA